MEPKSDSSTALDDSTAYEYEIIYETGDRPLPIRIDLVDPVADNVFICVTEFSRHFERPPSQFLANKQTKEFVRVLEDKVGIPVLRVVKGGQGKERRSGTWMHRLLALKYCGWLSPRFELWMMEQIDTLLRNRTVSLPNAVYAPAYPVPVSFSEALALAAAQQRALEEANGQLMAQNKLISDQSVALVTQQERLLMQEGTLTTQTQQLTTMREKVAITDQFLDSGRTLTMEQAAKAFGYGRNTFMQMLRARGLLCKSSRLPPGHLIDQGYFRVVVSHVNGQEFLSTQVTARGMEYVGKQLQL